MVDRIYGAVKGAGTQLRERGEVVNLVPAELGNTVMIGVFERGAEDDITICPTQRSQTRKMGGVLDPRDFATTSFSSLEAPRCAEEFWAHSGGQGSNTCLRVVPKTNSAPNDDRVDKSTLAIWSRGTDAVTPQYIGSMAAHNGGRWAGAREYFNNDITGVPAADFAPVNTVTLANVAAYPNNLKRDEFAGGTMDIHGITTKTYTIVSHTSDGVFTLGAEQDVAADWAAAGPPVDLEVTVYRDNFNTRGQEKYLAVEFGDGGLDPDSYFSMYVSVDGDQYLKYENLSMDTNHAWYWKDVVNNDPNNDLLVITDSFAGDRTLATSRPGNRGGLSKTLTANVLTLDDPYVYSVTSPVGAWVPVYTFDAYNTKTVPQLITCTVDGGGATCTVTTSISDLSWTLTIGVPFTMNEYGIDFTLAAGAGAATAGDVVLIYVRTLYTNELRGGTVWPDTAGNESYKIVSNTISTVTVTATDNMLGGATTPTGGENFRLQWPERFGGGHDGYVAGMVTSDYETVLEPSTTPLKDLKYMNMGLVKMAIPGIAKPSDALALQQKMKLVAREFNWQYRLEIPDGYTTEYDAKAWVFGSFGKDANSDMVVTFYPTYMNIRDNLADQDEIGREILVSTVGMQLGREAAVAAQYDGYHKAAAGVTVTLPLITSSAILGRPDARKRLDEELLNPAGINVYRWNSFGTIIAWGDRTLSNGANMKFKHKREQLSHYGNILLEGFDWAIFEINDAIGDAEVAATLHSFFRPEFRKRAIRGEQFVGGNNPAAIIKVDQEINTDATRAAGDTYAEVSLRLADTRERLKISLGAMGIVESV